MYQTFRPLLDALKRRGADPEAVDRAAKEAERTGRSIRAVLINDRVVTETELTESSAEAYGFNSLDLVGYPVDPEAVARIPLSLVLRHRVLGLAINGDEIVVGVTDPSDVVALDDVRAATGLIVRPVVVARSEVRKILDRLQREGTDLRDVAAGRSVDLRTGALPTVWGEKVVLRVLDTGGFDLDLRKLGFTEANYERYSASFTKPHGMLLVTGPTGSGKSTTLYATLADISKPTINIITVEDPVEYRLPGVNQVQVNHKAGLTFAAVLPAILRSDPDIVLIGEIRDRATAQLAVEAALTGHLVLSTLHTNDAPSAITRLTEMGIEPFLVGSSVDCVLAQRLARRLCDWCKQEYEPTEASLAGARWPESGLPEPGTLWTPVGCRSCAGTGYRGRIALHEVMAVSEEIEKLAALRSSAHEIQRVALAEGMRELRVDGLAKAAAGQTSIPEVLRVAV